MENLLIILFAIIIFVALKVLKELRRSTFKESKKIINKFGRGFDDGF